jgi:hypothetical protein
VDDNPKWWWSRTRRLQWQLDVVTEQLVFFIQAQDEFNKKMAAGVKLVAAALEHISPQATDDVPISH